MRRLMSIPPKMTWPGLEYLAESAYWLWSELPAVAPVGLAMGLERTSSWTF